jgi:D-glucosaminate-6-phosphate ammonia-lyase
MMRVTSNTDRTGKTSSRQEDAMATQVAPTGATTAAMAASGGTVMDIYTELGLRPVINGRGNQTVLGGALLSPKVQAAMDAANRYFVDMDALLTQTGRMIAEQLECEAAYVTPGCAAAMTLGTAACIVEDDGAKMERLPDTTGMKREVIIQAKQRYKYDRAPTVCGAVLREVGDANGTTKEQLAAAIGQETAVVLFPAHMDGQAGTVSLTETIAVAHDHNVPVLVDAASQIFPVSRMKSWTKLGADLVCFGAKYLGAPHSSGLLCGAEDLVASAAQQGFIGFERGRFRTIGRPLKLDRGEILAVAVAVREWVTMDHEARIARIQERVNAAVRRLEGVSGITASSAPNGQFGTPVLRIEVKPGGRMSAEQLATELERGTPGIVCARDATSLRFYLGTIYDGDELVVADRIQEVVGG